MANKIRNISERWAYDIDKNPIDQGEIWDADVINQSIEMILSTIPGERVFNPSFGYGLQTKIFDLFSQEEAETILDEIANVIKFWEDRITILESEMKVIANVDKNYIILIIPYIIKRTQIQSVFKKKIISNT
jgi:phage baseplate assembly protein W